MPFIITVSVKGLLYFQWILMMEPVTACDPHPAMRCAAETLTSNNCTETGPAQPPDPDYAPIQGPTNWVQSIIFIMILLFHCLRAFLSLGTVQCLRF